VHRFRPAAGLFLEVLVEEGDRCQLGVRVDVDADAGRAISAAASSNRRL